MKWALRATKSLLKLLRNTQASALAFVGLFVVIGISALLLAKAVTPSVSGEAESQVITGNARKLLAIRRHLGASTCCLGQT